MSLEPFIVGALVLGAILYLVLRIRRAAKSGGCSSGGGCGGGKQPRPVFPRE
jgi:hypothetical protein